MANEEHLEILRQGVKVWNQWREDNPEIKPDLNGAPLKGPRASGIDLSNANLSSADLSNANLSDAILIWANLSDAILNKANLHYANLSGANLSFVILSKADLSDANISRARLIMADLSGANLSGANLSGANLSGANLISADLISADLGDTILGSANLSKTRLIARDFSGRNLRRVCFQDAHLQRACLINTRMDGANLTDAHLWETQRAGWSIKGVICESVYWDEEAEVKTIYQPGDFERLFSEQNKIKLFYKDGANLLEIATLPSIIKNLEEKHPGCKLSFQSIEETSGGAIATLVLEESKDIAVEEVEAVRATIQAEAERNIEAFRHALVSKDKDIAELQGEVKTLDRIINTMMSKLQPVIYINQGQVEAMGDSAHAHGNTSNQIVNAENSSVETQIKGDRNVAIDGNVSDGNIITGDKNNDE